MKAYIDNSTGELKSWWDDEYDYINILEQTPEGQTLVEFPEQTMDEFNDLTVRLCGPEVGKVYVDADKNISVHAPEVILSKDFKEAFSEVVTEKKLALTKTITVADVLSALNKMG